MLLDSLELSDVRRRDVFSLVVCRRIADLALRMALSSTRSDRFDHYSRAISKMAFDTCPGAFRKASFDVKHLYTELLSTEWHELFERTMRKEYDYGVVFNPGQRAIPEDAASNCKLSFWFARMISSLRDAFQACRGSELLTLDPSEESHYAFLMDRAVEALWKEYHNSSSPYI